MSVKEETKIDFKALESTFKLGHMPSDILLGSAKMLDPNSKNTSVFQDLRYFPFYYHLGKMIQHPVKVAQIGSKLGLIAACFIQGCDYPVEWHAMDEASNGINPPANIIRSNIRQFGKIGSKGEFSELSDALSSVEKFQIGFLTEKYNLEKTQRYMEWLWERLVPEGLLVIDYIHDDGTRELFDRFCRVKNRESVIFDTRYQIGMLNK